MTNDRTRSRAWLPVAAFATLLLSSAPALAQDWTPRTQGNRLGGDADFLPTRDTKLFNVSFIGQLRLARHVYLDFDLPWGYAGSRHGDDQFVIGNPTVGAHYATWLGRRVAFFVGGALTAPTHLRNSDNTGAAYVETVTRAYDDFYRFLSEYVDVHARVGVELGFRPFFMRFDARPVLQLPVGRDVDRVDLVVLHGAELELLANMGVGGGVRLQAVVFPTQHNLGDRAQLAFEPYFAYEPEPRGFFARVGLLVAADPPLGFGFDRDRVATLRATLGGKW